MKPAYLFDASSIIRALKEARLLPLAGQALQWLTVYEVLNALWKEAYLLRRLGPEEAYSLVSDFAELVRNMVVLEPGGLEREIIQMAISKGATAYDASYIALAMKNGLTLVTEDRKLRAIASTTIRVVGLEDIK